MKRISTLLATLTLAMAASSSALATDYTRLQVAKAYAEEVCHTMEITGPRSLRALATCYNEAQVMFHTASLDFVQDRNSFGIVQAMAEFFGCASSASQQASIGALTPKEFHAEIEACDNISLKKMDFHMSRKKRG